jgi:hypothetical protein
MSNSHDAGPATLVRDPANPSAMAALAGAITSEIRLLEDLVGIMRRQRAAVAEDDLQGVDDTVFATHRILATLGEARRQRRSLGRFLGGTDDLALRALDDSLGDRMTDALRDARDGLHAIALTLTREVEMNRRVLRGALSAGQEYVRAICGRGDGMRPYTPESGGGESEAPGGFLINRQA